jgi:hypothetical protein
MVDFTMWDRREIDLWERVRVRNPGIDESHALVVAFMLNDGELDSDEGSLTIAECVPLVEARLRELHYIK